VTEYRLDARIEREPSCELIVFCRVICGKEFPDDVDVREGACSETAILRSRAQCVYAYACCAQGDSNLADAEMDVGQRALVLGSRRRLRSSCALLLADTMRSAMPLFGQRRRHSLRDRNRCRRSGIVTTASRSLNAASRTGADG